MLLQLQNFARTMATSDSKFFYLFCILDSLRRSWTNCALVLFFWIYEGAGEKEIRPLLSNARYCCSTFGLSSSKAVPFPSPVLLLLQLHLTLFSCLGRERRRRERERSSIGLMDQKLFPPPFPDMRRDLNFPLSENPPLTIFGCISNAHTLPHISGKPIQTFFIWARVPLALGTRRWRPRLRWSRTTWTSSGWTH